MRLLENVHAVRMYVCCLYSGYIHLGNVVCVCVSRGDGIDSVPGRPLTRHTSISSSVSTALGLSGMLGGGGGLSTGTPPLPSSSGKSDLSSAKAAAAGLQCVVMRAGGSVIDSTSVSVPQTAVLGPSCLYLPDYSLSHFVGEVCAMHHACWL